MIHSVLKHRCVMLRDNRSAVALIKTSSANLSKNSPYCITNCELCVCFTHNEELPHRRHVYTWMWALVCRPNGPAQRVSSWDELMRGVRFEAAATDRRITSKYPRERFESVCSLDRSARAASSPTEKVTTWKGLALSEDTSGLTQV